MPWTFAHAAAVVPLRRLCPAPLNFAALVVGSLTPDLGYYIGSMSLARQAHSFIGSFVVCLPSGLALLFAFYLLRRHVWFVLPEPHRSALQPLVLSPIPVRMVSALSAIASILIGAWSHIVWDSFTHATGWFVLRWSFLQEPLLRVKATELPAYSMLQHASTVIGAVALAFVYFSWLSRHTRAPSPPGARVERWRYGLLAMLSVLALVAAVPLAVQAAELGGNDLFWKIFVFRFVTYGTVSFAAMLMLSSVLCYALRRKA